MTTKFTTDHEWINIEDHDAAVVGITLHAQDALGDVVFVDLPAVGRSFAKGEIAGVVESVKAAADIYMPVSGEIVYAVPPPKVTFVTPEGVIVPFVPALAVTVNVSMAKLAEMVCAAVTLVNG